MSKRIKDIIDGVYDADEQAQALAVAQSGKAYEAMTEKELAREIKRLEKDMTEHARNLEFEQAAAARDALYRLRQHVFGADVHGAAPEAPQ